jgi:hypothetical protein
VQIVRQTDLARESCVIAKIRLGRQNRTLGFADLARVACKYLDTTRRTARVPAASMKDIDSVILKAKNEFASGFGFKSYLSIGGFRSYFRHISLSKMKTRQTAPQLILPSNFVKLI